MEIQSKLHCRKGRTSLEFLKGWGYDWWKSLAGFGNCILSPGCWTSKVSKMKVLEQRIHHGTTHPGVVQR